MKRILKKIFRRAIKAYLVDREGTYRPLNLYFNTKIGRSGECHIKILNDFYVSREHALVTFNQEEKKFFIKDLGSKHGTFVNGVKIEEGEQRELKENDHIRLGKDTYFTFKML